METITLHNINGIARLSGTDSNNCQWAQFEVDYSADQLPGTCSICEAELESGWICLDGGEEVCDKHIYIAYA